MQRIYLDNQAYDKPDNWGDVNPERLPELLQLVYFTPESGANYHNIIKLALNVRPRTWKGLMQKHFSPNIGKKARQANALVLHELYRSLKWMETEPIHKQPFESITVKRKTLLGEAEETLLLFEEGFLTMSFGELTDAYVHFLVYIRQLVPGNDHLHLLLSTVCRPARSERDKQALTWDGDKREPYNEFIAKERASRFSGLEEGVKMAILLYFAGNMNALLQRYKVHGGSEGEVEEYPGQGFVKNQHLLAEKGIFGTLQETKAVNVHEVMIFLEEHVKDLHAENERRKEAQQ